MTITDKKNLWILLVTVFVSNIGSYLVIPILAVYLEQVGGMSVTAVGSLFAVMGLLQLAGSAASGATANRIGPKQTLLFALALRVVGFPLCLFKDAPILIWGGCCLIWLGSGMYVPTSKSVISALATNTSSAKYLALRSSAANSGVVIGPALGILLSPLLGNAGLFSTAAAFFMIAFAANSIIRLPVMPDEHVSRADFLGWRRVLYATGARALLLMSATSYACLAIFEIVVPIFGVRHVTANAPQLAFILNATIVSLFQGFVAFRIERLIGAYDGPIALLFLALSCFVISNSSENPWLFSFGVVIFSFGEVLLFLAIDVRTSRLPGSITNAFAVVTSVGMLGGALGTQIFSALFDRMAPFDFWMTASAINVLVAAVAFWSLRAHR